MEVDEFQVIINSNSMVLVSVGILSLAALIILIVFIKRNKKHKVSNNMET